jgi:hypothetical protein
MNFDCPRTKLVIYRPDLKPVFERLSTAPMKPLDPQFIPLFRPRIMKDEPSQQTIRDLPPSQTRSYAAFTIARQKLKKAMRVTSKPISGVCSHDTSFDTEIITALRTNSFKKIKEAPVKASPKTPSIKKLNRSLHIVRKPVVLENSNGLPMMMLFNSSFTSDSCPSSTSQVPAYIRSDESEFGDLREEKTSGRLSRIPSLRDYPLRRFKVELQESIMTKLSLGQPLPTKTIKPDQPYYRVSTALKGSRVKQGPHAPFRPVLQRELTPNHFKRAVPGSKLV